MNSRSFPAVAVWCALALAAWTPAVAQSYRSHAQIGQLLLDAQTNYPTLAQRYNLGYSVLGRELWAIRITDNVGVQEDEPEFKYISTMHGDEITGVEMCLYLMDELLTKYGSDPQITNLVDEVEIWIVPLMNPDGYESVPRTRYNDSGVDLNRDFPEGSDGDPNTTAGRAPETAAIMTWSAGQSFTLSANYHGGALVANYPFDDDNMGSTYSATPDDDLFTSISLEYSQLNTPMYNSASFPNGITNGADWYMISGGMQDWSYRYMGCNEITIELSNTKEPPASQIPTFWSQNRDSMLAYMDTSLIGIRGLVTDALTGQPIAATVTVAGRNHDVYTDPDVGDYHRMLRPGTYNLTVAPNGPGHPVTVNSVVVSAGPATRQDVGIWLGAQVSYPNGGEALPVNVETTVSWLGDPQAQFQVQSQAGTAATLTDDFESSGLDPAYSSGGNAPWYLTAADAHAGAQSARAGSITHLGQSWMTRTVSGDGVLSFWYRVSSEQGWDLFKFYIDGNLEFQDSGTTGGWEFYTTTLSAGGYQLRWEYNKDYSVSKGDDTVYIDDLEIIPTSGAWTDIIALTAVGAASTPWTPASTGSAYKVRVRPYYSDTGYGGWDESDASFTVESVGADGDYDTDGDVDLADYAAFAVCFQTPPTGACGNAFELVADGVIDLNDFVEFWNLMLGP